MLRLQLKFSHPKLKIKTFPTPYNPKRKPCSFHKMHLQIFSGLITLVAFTVGNPLHPLQSRQLGSCATAPCAPGLCCSFYNFCGTGPDYCQADSCVGGVGGSCAAPNCCSAFGYCGVGVDFCGSTPPPTSTISTSK